MKVTRKQLFDIIRNTLNEVNYYTKKFTFGSEEAAKKFEAEFDDNSTVPWTSSYDGEEKSVTLTSKMEYQVSVKIFEAKGQEYDVAAYYGNDDGSSIIVREKGLNPGQLKEFISNIDDVVIKVLTSRVRGGAR